MWQSIFLVVVVLLLILQLQKALQLFPYLTDSVFRARGSVPLENSLRISHDRNLLAATFLPAFILLMYRYRLYDPAFLQGLDDAFYLLSLAGVVLVYLLLRVLLYFLFRPRRCQDIYRLSRRVGYTYFILLMFLVLPTVGVLSLIHSNDLTIRNFILFETLALYLLFLLRRAQILSQFCNPLRTFLYLCALEFLPTALLVLPAIFL